MPNHCYQYVYLAGNSKKIDRLYKAVKEQKFLNAVVPEPSTMFRGALGDEEREMCESEGRPNWYDWRNENWNTKGDIYEVEICDEPTVERDIKYFTFRCWTAWAPPTPVWDRLHEMGFDIHADYQDEGGNFEGEYINGVDRSWKPEFEEEEAC